MAGIDTAGRVEAVGPPAERSVTVEEARKVIRSTAPALETVLPHCRLAVDHEFAAADQEIRPGAVLALIPPVSGGTT